MVLGPYPHHSRLARFDWFLFRSGGIASAGAHERRMGSEGLALAWGGIYIIVSRISSVALET
ncbi:hypothetical protein PILCRDRAFT_818698 [Piloderma croceum F 1598]|uniref:Uncharacterized protein n=1 Tax=Piloderma croceum (strain F 1598) TaxID=765440 RepID=A0A0C3BDE5_PILCF|nr:hypothetical protein PILCRDRAFT_818698 [Piloderma croceum F 1598]